MINKTILVQLGVVWLSLTQGAFVPRNQRSAGLDSDFRPSSLSPSTLQSSLSNFNRGGFNEYNPGSGVALPVSSYPFGFPTSGFDLNGLQFQPLQQAYSAPSGDFRFPGFGFDVSGYPFAVPPQYNAAPLQFSPAAGNDLHQLRALAETGLRFDAVPRALPAANGPTRSLQPSVPVFVGESTVGQTYVQRAPQTNDVSAQYIAPNSAAVPPQGLNEVPPRQYSNQVGDERQVRVLTAGADFNISPATDQPQPIQTSNDLIATPAPPSPSSLAGAEPVADLVLELRPPPYTAADANPDASFSSSDNGPSPQPSYPQPSYPQPFATNDPVSGPGSASSASGPGPAVATPSPPSNVGSFDGTKNALAPYPRDESYTTTAPPAGLAPDAYPTPSISYTLPSETFHLPADAYGSPNGPENAPDHRMNPIVVSEHSSHPVQVPSGTVSGGPEAGSSVLPAGAGYYGAYGSSNPVSANTYSDSNAIQGSTHGNAAVHPKLVAGTYFVDSNSISSNGKRETSNADRSGNPPPSAPQHRQPNDGSE